MSIDIPDLTTLSLVPFFGLLILVAAVDVLTAIAIAVIRNTFKAAVLMDYLRTHVLLRVFPIFALAVIGHGIPALAVPAIWPAWLAAAASLVAYVVETIKSLTVTFATAPAPTPPAA